MRWNPSHLKQSQFQSRPVPKLDHGLNFRHLEKLLEVPWDPESMRMEPLPDQPVTYDLNVHILGLGMDP